MKRYNTVQAAEELGVSPETVRLMFHRGQIPEAWQVRGKKGRIVIPREALERLKSRPACVEAVFGRLSRMGR